MEPTSTVNASLPHRLGTFSSLADALDYAAQGQTGINFYDNAGRLKEVVPYHDLQGRAQAAASSILALGLQRGERLAILAESGVAFLSLFYGCQYAGIIPCPLPFTIYPGGRSAYVAQLENMLRAAHCRVVVAPASVLACAEEAGAALSIRALSFESLFAQTGPQTLIPLRDDEAAYVQFSSGSTTQPKGVLITQRAVCANVQAILQHGMQLRPDDRAFSWLPFFHDMGLVGFSIAAMSGQCSVDYLSPSAFARRPALWLELMSANASTITYSPSFGYRLATQRFSDDRAVDLSRLRIAGIGGDMIRPDVLEKFAQKLAGHGFRFEAFLPSYGMAEATLAISITQAGQGPRIDTFASRRFVACGQVLPQHQVMVVDEAGQPLPQKTMGHVWVRGPSMMNGYLDNPDATGAVMRPEGFMDTGDMGYWLDDQVVVTGRAKELILVRGRNIWPQDIEWAVERVIPLTEGCAAAFSVEREEGDGADDSEDELVVLVQVAQSIQNDPSMQEALRAQLSAAISQAVGVVGRIVFVPLRSLPHTSSGKLSRIQAREKYLAGEFKGGLNDM